MNLLPEWLIKVFIAVFIVGAIASVGGVVWLLVWLFSHLKWA